MVILRVSLSSKTNWAKLNTKYAKKHSNLQYRSRLSRGMGA